jgi:arginase
MVIKLLGVATGKGGPGPGAEDGPYQLRRQGLVTRLLEAGHEVEDLGDIPGVYETRFATRAARQANYLAHSIQVNRHLHACVLGTRRKSPEAFLLIIGGDHSLAIGAIAGLSDACTRLGIVWVDAHADFNTPHTSPTGNIHGMSLAVACGLGLDELSAIADRSPVVRSEDVILLGCRAVDAGELENVKRCNVRMLSTDEWRERGIVSVVRQVVSELQTRCDHIHLSFDIDVLDADVVSGTGTPVPGGLLVDEATALLADLGRSGAVGSAEFVEYNPKLDRDGSTGKLTLALLEAFFGRTSADACLGAG